MPCSHSVRTGPSHTAGDDVKPAIPSDEPQEANACKIDAWMTCMFRLRLVTDCSRCGNLDRQLTTLVASVPRMCGSKAKAVQGLGKFSGIHCGWKLAASRLKATGGNCWSQRGNIYIYMCVCMYLFIYIYFFSYLKNRQRQDRLIDV